MPEPTVHTHEPTEVQGQSLRTHPLHPQNGRKSKTTTQNRRDKPNPGRRHSTADADGRNSREKRQTQPVREKEMNPLGEKRGMEKTCFPTIIKGKLERLCSQDVRSPGNEGHFFMKIELIRGAWVAQ